MRFHDFLSMLEFHAEKAPEHVAFYYEDGGLREITYAGFLREIREKARVLADSGFRRFGVLCDGQLPCVISVFACALAGAQAALLDPTQPAALLDRQILRTDTECLIDREGRLRPVGAATPEPAPHTPCYLFFTSGTTVDSRAVILTEQSLCASAWNGSYMAPLGADDTLLCVLPLNHVFGFVCGMLWGLHCGAAVALGRGLRYLTADCAYFRPTAVSLVPSMLELFERRELMNPELGTVLIGAGACAPALLDAAKEKRLRVCFGYGLTETASGVAISVSGDPFAMEICPDDRIEIAADGEILIDAPTCMMLGYYKEPEKTAEVLRGGLLFTGDLGYLDETGRLHVSGRKNDVLVLGDGTKIFLPEYEQRLAAALPGRDLAVTEQGGRPALVLTGDETEKDAVLRAIGPVVSLYAPNQQIRRILFRAEPLPRTATGKLIRWKL